MKGLKIQKPKKEDFDEIFELLKQLWPKTRFNKTLVKRIFTKTLVSGEKEYLVAKYEGEVLGFFTMTIRYDLEMQGKDCYAEGLVIREDYRGRGIGKKMLQEAVRRAKKKGCIHFNLISAHFRKRAHKFYKTQGFRSPALYFAKKI